ncbi:Membrane-bound transcription factor site-2 protease, partial [Rhizoclosmatium hyalinum]
EQVQMQAAGVFIWFIYPGAFVDLDDTALKFISPWAKLKIVCAGVWHNAVFAITSLAILMTLPSWIGWVYRDLRSIHNGSAWNGGVVVLDVEKQSPLHTNLPVGSIIMAVNEVQISFGVNDWDTGLAKALETSASVRQGYCIDKEVISNGPASCCNVDLERPLGDYGNAYQCFLPHDIVNMRPLIELHKDAVCIVMDLYVF